MNTLDKYMEQDVYEYLNTCDKVKCHKISIKIKETDHPIADIFYYGCHNNIVEMFNYSIEKCYKWWFCGLHGACYGGNIEIIKIIIKKYGNGADVLWDACNGGYIDIVELLIKKGAHNWNGGLGGACHGGHIEIIEMMIKKGANGWNDGLLGACLGGHKEIVEMMIEKGATKCCCGKPFSHHLKK